MGVGRRHRAGARKDMMRFRTGLLLGLVLALGVAGCGGDGGNGVATAGGPDGKATGTPRAGEMTEQERALKFGQCMRDNGVPGFADPVFNEKGGMSIEVPEGSDPQKVDAAMEACKEFLPNGGEPTKLDPGRLDQLRRFAQCMRDNGVTNFPDPTDQGLQLDGNNPEFAPDNPTFQQAQKACAKFEPAPGPGESPGLSSKDNG